MSVFYHILPSQDCRDHVALSGYDYDSLAGKGQQQARAHPKVPPKAHAPASQPKSEAQFRSSSFMPKQSRDQIFWPLFLKVVSLVALVLALGLFSSSSAQEPLCPQLCEVGPSNAHSEGEADVKAHTFEAPSESQDRPLQGSPQSYDWLVLWLSALTLAGLILGLASFKSKLLSATLYLHRQTQAYIPNHVWAFAKRLTPLLGTAQNDKETSEGEGKPKALEELPVHRLPEPIFLPVLCPYRDHRGSFTGEPTLGIDAFSHRHSIATRQGKVRAENQDAVWGHTFSSSCSALIVCDGAGGHKGGKQAAEQAVRVIAAVLSKTFEAKSHQPVPFGLSDLSAAIGAARQASSFAAIEGLTTALIAIVQGRELIYATLGDGAVSVLWPDGTVTHLQAEHHTAGQPSNYINAYIGDDCQVPPRKGVQILEPGCQVLVMSDGVSPLFPFEAYGLDRVAHKTAWDAKGSAYADCFLQELESWEHDSGAYVHRDNMSLGLIEIREGSKTAKHEHTKERPSHA